MSKEEIIEILGKAHCNDACECIFDLYDTDKKHNSICKSTNPPSNPWELEDCPFCKTIASLLKEQEPLPAEFEGGGYTWFYVCGDCHGQIDERDAYCRHCGRKVKWEK